MKCIINWHELHSFVSGIRIALRGKAHAEWKAIVGGDQRNLEDDQYFIDERDMLFGKGEQFEL